VQVREGREEQGAFEFLVPASAGVLSPDGRAGGAGAGRDAGIGRELVAPAKYLISQPTRA
jgi:hypothetical protein